MIPVSIKQILSLAPGALPVYRTAFANADAVLQPYGINATPLRLAHFMAQVLHETDGLTILTESLNYSAEGLLETFGEHRISRDLAYRIGRTDKHKADQVAIGESAYGGEWGRINLGNTQPGDGWNFRGCGLLQMTGRGSRERIGKRLGIDLVTDPAKALDPKWLLPIACEEWAENGCNTLADADDIRKVTRKINGGSIGIEQRRAWLTKTRAMWKA